jgi:major membrane immunogen (membrane-anchored lipoprotein)
VNIEIALKDHETKENHYYISIQFDDGDVVKMTYEFRTRKDAEDFTYNSGVFIKTFGIKKYFEEVLGVNFSHEDEFN